MTIDNKSNQNVDQTNTKLAEISEELTMITNEADAFSIPKLTRLLHTILVQQHITAELLTDSVSLDSGTKFFVTFIESEHNPDHGMVRTATVITAVHPKWFPEGIREYQHSYAKTLQLSLQEGFNAWINGDLVALEDAVIESPETCLSVCMQFPAEDSQLALSRRAIFGPVTLFVEQPTQSKECVNEDEDEHEFCPCCLLMRNIDSFLSLVKSDRFLAIRLFVSRDNDGKATADCRVNGEHFPEGANALTQYSQDWLPQGFEYRKQYVLVRSE